MLVKRVAVNFALLIVSTAVSIVFINILYIVLIRQPHQARGFPRHLIPDLPPPSRWLYADTGSKGNSGDIALLGDSYLEAIGDDFSDGLYNYSLAHFLHRQTGLQIAQYGTSGSYLPRQLALYQKALKGGYWPLYDRLDGRNVPARIVLFFYEGNDLNDYISSIKTNASDELNIELPFALRYFPIARLASRRFDRVVDKFKLKLNHSLKQLTQERLSIHTPPSASRSTPAQRVVAKPPGDPMHNGLEKSSVPKSDSLCGPHFCLPAGQSLQGPALELTADEKAHSIQATVSSVIQYSRQYPTRKVCLVYIPSPAVIYAPLFSRAFARERNQKLISNSSRFPGAGIVEKSSQGIRRAMFTRLKAADIPYVDTTPYLVESAKSKYLHGRQDVNHFNRYGYKIVVDSLVASRLKCLA